MGAGCQHLISATIARPTLELDSDPWQRSGCSLQLEHSDTQGSHRDVAAPDENTTTHSQYHHLYSVIKYGNTWIMLHLQFYRTLNLYYAIKILDFRLEPITA